MASLEFIALILTGLGLTASIIYYASILSNANKTQQQQLETRQTQLFMSINKDMTSKAFVTNYYEVLDLEFEDYQDFMEKYGDNREVMVKIGSLLNWYDGIGTLVRNGLLEESLVFELMGGMIMYHWIKYRDIVKGMVIDGDNNPSFWSGLRYVGDRMEKLMDEKEGGWRPKYRQHNR